MTELEQRGNRLNKIRLHYKLKQVALAQRIGVSRSFVSKMIGGKEDITHKVIDKLREAFPLLNINWLLYNDGEMFSAAKQNGMLVVKEPQALYGPESKEDLFGDLRALLEHYRYRIEGLEAEVGRLGERVRRLEDGKLE